MVVYLLFEAYKRLKLKTDQHTVLKIFYKKLILEKHRHTLEKQHKEVLDILCTAVITLEEESITYFNH